MPFNPFTNLTGKHACTLFEIRLDDDFIIFRGHQHEAAGQLLRGTIVLCLPAPLKVEDIHLRLTGQLRLGWTDFRATPSGIASHRVDRTRIIFNHKWNPFVTPPAGSSSRNFTLKAGNYEWPFELLLPGTTAESVEGLSDTSLTYKLKATIARGKLACDIHTYKQVRLVRTLEPAALEFLHAMSVENVWVNKIEYSIVIPQKAVVFGGTVPLDMRFTPLLKGLEMGDIKVTLVEIHDLIMQGPFGQALKGHQHEREVEKWTFNVNREEHWQDLVEETGQDGWVVHAPLSLPKKLRECVQDVDMHGIKIRHKLRLTVGLKNPDGHVSELRATLPITIFISPNMLLDDQGIVVRQQPGVVCPGDAAAIAPPGYGDHILDQLYDDVPTTGFQSPPLQSGLNSPFYTQSRGGSVDNLSSLATGMGMHNGVAPTALSSRLQNVAAVNGNTSISGSPRASSVDQSSRTSTFVASPGPELSQRPSNEDENDDPTTTTESVVTRTAGATMSGNHTPEHIDFSAEMDNLSRVPSYATAVRTPARVLQVSNRNGAAAPPDYRAAVMSTSAPASPTNRDSDSAPTSAPGMQTIHEAASARSAGEGSGWTARGRRARRDSGSSGRSGGSTSSGSYPITGRFRSGSARNSNSNSNSNSGTSSGSSTSAGASAASDSPRSSFFGSRGRASSLGLGFLHPHLHLPDSEERGRLHLIQARERVM